MGNRKSVRMIRNVGCGDCYALYFMVESRGYEWYDQNVTEMGKSRHV